MIYSHAFLLVTSGLGFAFDISISTNGWYDSIQHVIKSVSDQLPNHKPCNEAKSHISSIISLIPAHQYESWISAETEVAFESIIKNIGGYRVGIDDVMRGAVIASPSKNHPDYYYQVRLSNCHANL